MEYFAVGDSKLTLTRLGLPEPRQGPTVAWFRHDRFAAADASERYAGEFCEQAARFEAEAETATGEERAKLLRDARRLRRRAENALSKAEMLRTKPPADRTVRDDVVDLTEILSGRDRREGGMKFEFTGSPAIVQRLMSYAVDLEPDGIVELVRRRQSGRKRPGDRER